MSELKYVIINIHLVGAADEVYLLTQNTILLSVISIKRENRNNYIIIFIHI